METNEKVTDITALANTIASGQASEEEVGLALRAVQTALGTNMIATMQKADEGFKRLSALQDKFLEKFEVKAQEQLEADTIDMAGLYEMITNLQKNQVAYLDLYRKIIQSPNKIFPDDLISPDERKLMQLLKSFKTKEEKNKFMQAVQSAMKQSNDFDEE